MIPRILAILALVILLSFVHKVRATGSNILINNSVDFIHYGAEIKPDFATQSIQGKVNISFKPRSDSVKNLVFSAKFKSVTSVYIEQTKLGFSVIDDVLTIHFPKALPKGKTYEIKVTYKATPARGMKFYEDHLFTVYHTKNWLISHDDISDKASFDLYLIHDKKYRSVGNGRLLSQSMTKNDQLVSHWQQTTPIPLYTFGLALGLFEELSIETAKSNISILYRSENISGLSRTSIQTAYQDVADMLSFFEAKAGVELGSDYTYVVVNGYMAQEASGFSLVGENYVHTLLKNNKENWFIAHELAHEWWGNSITSTNFSHFWLNEGLVVYLVAAYKQHLFGEQAYNDEINLAMRRVQRAVKENRVAPVAFKTAIHEKDINRTMAYSKGALVFHMLREKLGDELFWQALKHYSVKYRGASVSTEDLKSKFEQVSNTDLTEFFDKWVFGETIPRINLQ